MKAGEEFIVTEGDEGGWTKVRRNNINYEEYKGYVQTTYLQCNGNKICLIVVFLGQSKLPFLFL